jgi:hypothetical protein
MRFTGYTKKSDDPDLGKMGQFNLRVVIGDY